MPIETKPLKVEAVVWDYGNCIVDGPFPKTIEAIAKPFAKKINAKGYSTTEEQFKKAITEADKTVSYQFCTHFTQEEPIIQKALKDLEIKPEDAAFLGPEYLIDYRTAMNKIFRTDKRNEEVKKVLQYIKDKGVKQAIFSNDRDFSLKNSLKQCGLINYFDLIKTSEETGMKKKDKSDIRVFKYLEKELGIKPEHFVYIGDDPKRDVESAKAAGWRAILLEKPKGESVSSWRDYHAESEYQPDFVVKNLIEIKERDLIRKI